MNLKSKEQARTVIDRNGGRIRKKRIFIGNAGLKVMSAIDYLITFYKYKWIKEHFNPRKAKHRHSRTRLIKINKELNAIRNN